MDGHSIKSLLFSNLNGLNVSAQACAGTPKYLSSNSLLVKPKPTDLKTESQLQYLRHQEDLVNYWFGEAKSRQADYLTIKAAEMNESPRMEARSAHRHDHSSHAVLSYSGQESNHVRKMKQASKSSGSTPATKKSTSNVSVIQGPHNHTPNSQYGSPSSKIQVSVLNNSAPPTSVSFSSTNNSSKYFVGSIIQVLLFCC